MAPAVHHALLGVSVAALGAAGLRAASPLAPRGLPRVLVAAMFATTAAVAEAIVLGALLALGGSAIALSVAAIATWLAARALLPRPEVPVAWELRTWWAMRSAPERALAGALVGGAATWALWQLRHPALGYDAIHYHLPEIVLWVQHGTPGSVENVLTGLPVGNYPVTTEVSIAWALGIARSYVPFVLWSWVTFALTVAGGWVGLRALRVRPRVAAAAVSALCSVPWVLAWQSNGSVTDPPALAWLVVCAALCALARERPALLAPALLAAALSIGAKTTALPLVVVVLAAGFWATRRRLRPLRLPLSAALAAGLLVGGGWYLRNLFDHGSPFWPIVATPWGDRVPASVRAVHTSFLDRPGATIDALGSLYTHRFGGGWLLLAAGVLAPLACASRRVLAAAALTLAGFLLWTRSPVTGLPPAGTFPLTIFSTTRYLLPVLAAATTGLALAATDCAQRRGRAPLAALALVSVVNVVETFRYYAFPSVPKATTPLLGAAIGAAAAVLAKRLPLPRRFAAAVVVVAAGALLALAASGFVKRHADTHAVPEWPIEGFLASDPSFSSRTDPVATTPSYVAVLAGDRLRHRLEAIGDGEPCERIRARAASQWLVVYGGAIGGPGPANAARCLAGRKPAFRYGADLVYGPPRR